MVWVAVAVTLSGCGGDGIDGSTQMACSRFASTAEDAADGVITEAELRDRIKDVESAASNSEVDGVADAARSMLSAITQNDTDSYLSAVDEFVAACNAAS